MAPYKIIHTEVILTQGSVHVWMCIDYSIYNLEVNFMRLE